MTSKPSQPSPVSARASALLRVAYGVQVLAALVVVFGDIGFDRPGRFGLDFGHLVLFIAPAWCVAALGGLILSLRAGKRWILIQVLLLAMPLVAFYLDGALR